MAAVINGWIFSTQMGTTWEFGPYNGNVSYRTDGTWSLQSSFTPIGALQFRGSYNPTTDTWAFAIGLGVSSSGNLQLSMFSGFGIGSEGLFGQITWSARARGDLMLGNRVDFKAPLAQILRDPLIIDLDGDGIQTTSLDGSTVHFDYDGNGFAERTAWLSSGDGILAFDSNQNGIVDGAGELFGSPTQDGFAVLETFDSNQDGQIDSTDASFADLRVWRDLNQNGVSDVGELQTLTEAGLKSISLSRTDVSGTNSGNDIGFQATVTRTDDSTTIAQTIYFQTDRQDTRADNTPQFTLAEGVDKLPYLPGSGNINSTDYKASVDTAFRDAWTELTDDASNMTAAELRASFEDLLLRWAGVENVDPHSRGSFVDARHLAFVEAFFGDTYRETTSGVEFRTFPGSQQTGFAVETSFQRIADVLETAFLADVVASWFARGGSMDDALASPYFAYSLLDFSDPDESDAETPGNAGAIAQVILELMPASAGEAASYLSRALIGLNGIVSVAFLDDREAYADTVMSVLTDISDPVLLDIATHIVEGDAFVGTTHSEGINGTSDADVFIGGGGGDVILAGAGSDIVVYSKSDGDLWVRDDSASLTETDRLVLTDLNAADLQFARIANSLVITITSNGNTIEVEDFFYRWGEENRGTDVIRFADGTEWDRADIQAASVFAGNDNNNTIWDTSLNDTINGSLGDDYILISGGNDTILYSRGDGYDLIQDLSDAVGERDLLVLTDLNRADVEISRVNYYDLNIKIIATGEIIRNEGFFSWTASYAQWATHGAGIDAVRFADGTELDRLQLQQEAWVHGDDYANSQYGSGLNDTFQMGKGDDYASGEAGSDTFIWKKGDGNDYIRDTADSATDVDTLVLSDVYSGGVRFSYQGNTLLIDVTDTGEVIQVEDFFSGSYNMQTDWGVRHYGIDVIQFANGETWDREKISHETGEHYLGRHYETTTWVIAGLVIFSYFTDEFGNQGNIIAHEVQGPHDVFIGAEGYDDNLDASFIAAQEAHNSMNGDTGNDRLVGGFGNDSLDGEEGDDTLYGDWATPDSGGGNDQLAGGDGNDALYGGGGLDQLDGGAGDDYLNGGAGKDYLDGGYIGNDRFDGGTGDDIIQGDWSSSAGNDTYFYSVGDGFDTISDAASGNSGTVDVLVLDDMNAADIELSRVGFDLLIKTKANGQFIRVVEQFSHSEPNQQDVGLEIIRFANGEEWDRARIQQEAWYRGTSPRDALDGTTLDETFEGGSGNDSIVTGWNFGSGSDTIVYSRGDGDDVVNDPTFDTYDAGVDRLILKDMTAADVEFSRVDRDVLIRTKSNGEVLRIVNQFDNTRTDGPDVGIEIVRFADGTEWDRARIHEEAWYRGSNVRDTIYGTTEDETFEGGQGDDNITGGYNFGAGNDTFVYAKGDGNDVINAPAFETYAATTDTLQFRDIDDDEVLLNRSGNDMLIQIVETGETIRIINQFGGTSGDHPDVGLEVIRFGNGVEWTREVIHAAATTGASFFAGTNGDDVINGSALPQNLYGERGNDIIDGKGGSDLQYGGFGDDTLVVSVSNAGDVDELDGGVGSDTVDFSAFGAAVSVDLVVSGAEARTTDQPALSTGTWRDIAQIASVENITGSAFDDQLAGDAGDNAIAGGAGNDALDGRSGNDALDGGAGNDNLVGGMGNDTLTGGEGDDTIGGGLGNDTIEGGAGNDVLTGDSDADRFLFGPGFGQDQIADFVAGADVITFDRSVFADFAAVQAAATQVGSDVVIDAGTNGTLTLTSVTLSALDQDDFAFVRLDNKAPTSVVAEGASVAENAAAGTVVTTLAVVDPDAGDTHSYEIVGTSSLFEIVGDEIRVKSGAAIDFEAASSQTLQVRATDADGLSVVSTIQIAVTDAQDVFSGTSAGETLTGGIGADLFDAGAGSDRLVGLAGSDVYEFGPGDGDDHIVEAGSAADTDRLVLGAGIAPEDVRVGRSSLNNQHVVLSLGLAGVIVLENQLATAAGAGIEEIAFANGTVWNRAAILSHLDSTLILGTSAGETLAGSSGAETFDAGAGNDVLSGHAGSDVYRLSGASGNDTVVEDNEAGTDRIELAGLNAADVEGSRIGSDFVLRVAATGQTFAVHDQFAFEQSGVEQIAFADGTVWGRSDIRANAWLRGTSGNDTLNGSTGNDVMAGAAGNDTITGYGGSDTYHYWSGDGNDTIQDMADFAADVDTHWLRDINSAGVTLSRQNANLVIQVNSTGQTITVNDQFASTTTLHGIEILKFADGATFDRAQIRSDAWIRGTTAAETVTGTNDPDTIDGLEGNDTLSGGWGGDTYVHRSGSGNDTVDDTSTAAGEVDKLKLIDILPANVVLNRAGNDLVVLRTDSLESVTIKNHFNTNGVGIEQIVFDNNTTWDRAYIAAHAPGTSGNDSLYGPWADVDETFLGGLGNDYLEGHGGNDTYIFRLGDGQDTVADWGGSTDLDVLKFGPGILPGNVTVTQLSMWDVRLSIGGTSDFVTLGYQLGGGYGGVDQVRFADNTVWDRETIFQKSIIPTTGNDTFNGDYRTNTISGGGGNDNLYGRDGDDQLSGDTGNDYLEGGNGNDTYLFNLGDGQDTVSDWGLGSDVDVLQLGPGILPGNVSAAGINANDIRLSIGGTSETITLVHQLSGVWGGVDQVRFADDTVWDRATLFDKSVVATAGNDTVNGDYTANTLSGGAGNDSLYGRDGDDQLSGDTGNDYLEGGAGNDTYLFNLGDGQDRIFDWGNGSDIDTVRFGAGIATSDVTVTLADSGSDIVLSINGTSDSVVLDNRVLGSYAGADQVRFDDGTIWDYATLYQKATHHAPTGSVIINGSAAEDQTLTANTSSIQDLDGLGTLHYQWQRSSNGGADWSNVGADQATYLLTDIDVGSILRVTVSYTDGGGTAESLTSSATDAIADDNYTPVGVNDSKAVNEDAVATGSVLTNDSDADIGDVIRVSNVSNVTSGSLPIASGGNTNIVGVYGTLNLNSDGSYSYSPDNAAAHDLLPGQAATDVFTYTVSDTQNAGANATLTFNITGVANTFTGTAGDDTLSGTLGPDTFDGQGGNDTLIGGAGADTLIGGTGTDAASYATAPAGVVANLATPGSNTGHAAGDTYSEIENLTGSAFADTLTGDANANTLDGGAGNDTLDGGAGNDVLIGGAGADVLNGNTGTDTASYATAAAGVTANLTTPAGNTGDAAGDTYTAIENLTGSAFADTLTGTTGANALDGGAGDDTLIGGAGADALTGGTGIDTASYATSTAAVTVNMATPASNAGDAAGDTYSGIENVAGGSAADNITGDGNNNSISGNAGNDTLNGGAGNDTLDGGAGNDTLVGGSGDDTYIVNASSDVVTEIAGEGNDEVRSTALSYTLSANVENLIFIGAGNFTGTGNAGNNVLTGGSGTDVLIGGAGADTLIGEAGIDTASYSTSSTTVTADLTISANNAGDAAGDTYSGIENLTGGSGADTLTGDDNANVLSGGAGTDTLNGQGDDDVLIGGAGADALNGGAGTDTASYATSTSAVTANLAAPAGNTGDAAGDTYTDIENLTGGSAGDTLTGNAGNNVIDGGTGTDTLAGGAGDDIYIINDTKFDVVIENAGQGTDTVWTSLGLYNVLANNVENVVGTAADYQHLEGNALANVITLGNAGGSSAGKDGNDVLNGGAGDDWLVGGPGSDILNGGAGIDTAGYNGLVTINLATGVYTGEAAGDIFNSIEIIHGSNQDDTLIGDANDNWLQGANGNDTLMGGAGADTLDGGVGTHDVVSYASSPVGVTVNLETGFTAGGDAEGDTLIAIEDVTGSAFADVLTAGSSDSILTGGAGDDLYLLGDTDDNVTELAGGGFDEVRTTALLAVLNVNVENLIFTGTGNFTGYGNTGSNLLTGGAGNDILIGAAGADTLIGGAGTDTASYSTAAAAVTVNLATGVHAGDAAGDIFNSIEIIAGSNYDDSLVGDDSVNWFKGGSGNDTLMGGAGADTLDGGAGSNDIASYATSQAAVSVNLATGVVAGGDAQGDTLIAIEGVTGSAFADTLIGDSANNTLNGGAGNDTLDGGAGFDTFAGGAGDDVYFVDAGSDAITELAGEGTDEVRATALTYTLSANIENLIFIGSGNFAGTGNAGNNVLTGGAGDDTLTGGAGADTLNGGAGIDTASYSTSTTAVIADLTNPGSNTGDAANDVYSSIENLTGGSAADTLTGDAGDNVLNGGAGIDTLDGGAGDDVLIGGAGADALTGGAGIDTVSYSTSSGAVSANLATLSGNVADATGDTYSGIENLIGGSGGDSLTGDGNANVLNGLGGNDGLYGGAGDDVLIGGAGADILNGDAGTDTASYFTATAGVTANLATPSGNTGHAAGDSYTAVENLIGSSFADTLKGDANANTIEGAAGNDALTGAAGNDTFVFHAGFGLDTISDFAAGGDVIQIDTLLFADFGAVQSHATQVGSNTVITYDAGNTITLTGVSLSALNANDFLFV